MQAVHRGGSYLPPRARGVTARAAVGCPVSSGADRGTFPGAASQLGFDVDGEIDVLSVCWGDVRQDLRPPGTRCFPRGSHAPAAQPAGLAARGMALMLDLRRQVIR